MICGQWNIASGQSLKRLSSNRDASTTYHGTDISMGRKRIANPQR
jgi:hypothetical protein